MTPSRQLCDFLKGYEQLRLRAYKPTPRDVWTLGYGHTAGVKSWMTCTVAQAEAWFVADVTAFAAGVSKLLHVPTTQQQFDALVSLAYNIGLGAFAASTPLRLHNAGHYADVPAGILLFHKQDGIPNRGLARRRADEVQIYTSGNYTRN